METYLGGFTRPEDFSRGKMDSSPPPSPTQKVDPFTVPPHPFSISEYKAKWMPDFLPIRTSSPFKPVSRQKRGRSETPAPETFVKVSQLLLKKAQERSKRLANWSALPTASTEILPALKVKSALPKLTRSLRLPDMVLADAIARASSNLDKDQRKMLGDLVKHRGTIVGGGGKNTTDRYPNFMSGILTMTAANVFTTDQVFTPISRLQKTGPKIRIMELLWFDVSVTILDLLIDGGFFIFGLSLGASPEDTTVNFGRPNVIGSVAEEIHVAGAPAAGLASVTVNSPRRYDWQSADGYGYLLASDSFNVFGGTAAQANPSVFGWKIYYRFVEVNIAEYIGIVQSQTQAI